MVRGIVLADPVQAVIWKLRTDPDVAALCSQNQPPGRWPRINSSFPESSDPTERWIMPDFAVLVVRAGGPAPDWETGRRHARFDFRFYGPGRTIGIRRRLGDQLWRTVDPVLNPPPDLGISGSFHFGGCIVHSLIPEADPMEDMEKDTDWPVWIVPYLCTYMSLRAAA